MGVEMYLGQSDQQAGTASSVLSNRISAYESIKTSLQSFIETTNLQGYTYTSAKDYSSQVLVPLLKGCILLDKAVKEACAKLPSEYRSQVDTIDLREDELRDKIQQAGLTASRYEYLASLERQKEKPNWSRVSDLSLTASRYMEIERRLQEKLEKLLAFHSSSAHLFSPIQPLLDSIQQGLKQATSSWNPATKSFDVVRPALGWATSLDKQWYDKTTERAKTLIAKVESGRDLTSDELNELGGYLVENPKSELYDQGMKAFYSSIKGIKTYNKDELPNNIKIDDDISDLDAGIDAYQGKSSTGDENLGASITALRAGASAGIMTPFSTKNSKKGGSSKKSTTLALGAKAKVEVVAAEAEGHARYGDDKNNVHGSLYGASHTASADASAAIGRFTNEEGELTTGVQAEAGADAYILEGEAKAGFTVFGLKIDVSGSAGIGVSARAKVGVTTQSAEAKLKLGPFGLGLSIGW